MGEAIGFVTCYLFGFPPLPPASPACTFSRLISLQLPRAPAGLGSGQGRPPPSWAPGPPDGQLVLVQEIALRGDFPLSGAQPLPL